MKLITQKQIAIILSKETASVSRYLTGKRAIKLTDALLVSKELDVPIEIFTDAQLQLKYFGKSYIDETITDEEKVKEVQSA
jgi:transcriptional regulator with XRE-family HTH domain